MKGFIAGITLASLIWSGGLFGTWLAFQREKVEILDEAYREAYQVKEHNKKLQKENRNLTRILRERSRDVRTER